MNLLFLYAQFFQIGLFSVGGGLATLPFLCRLADKQDWLPPELLGPMQAAAQSLPGAIGVNMAAYAGFQYAGIPGAFTAALGLISPSIIIITIIAHAFRGFKESPLVKAVFSGLRPAAGGLLCAVGFGAVKLALYTGTGTGWQELVRWREGLLLGGICFLIFKFKKHPIVYIGIAGAAGVILKL
jgi:chromate transporter